MKYTAVLALVALCFDSATATPVDISVRQNGGSGAGPYAPATYRTESTLRDHTIYYPTKSTGSTKMPVFIWGNGACSNQGLSNQALLQQIASYGFLAISEGGPQGGGGSNSQTMKAAIDWVTSNAGKGNYANVDAGRIMAAGFSCGGTEAMDNIWDSRVDTIGVISSGLLSNYTAASAWRKPVLFVMGGSGDIAYQNAERDYKNMASGVPVWKGNIPVGHGGTLGDQNGGRFGKAILNWLLWTLKGDTNAAKYFTAGGSSADGYQVEQKSLNLLKPFV